MELLQRTWGQMCFTFAFRFWHQPDILLRFHIIKPVTRTCESPSARTQICFTIDRFWESDSTMEKCFALPGYWTSRSMFVTNVFEPGLCNFDMWTNQFLNLKGMAVLENQCLFTAQWSLFCFVLNDYIDSTFSGRCKKLSPRITTAPHLNTAIIVCTCAQSPFGCSVFLCHDANMSEGRRPWSWTFACCIKTMTDGIADVTPTRLCRQVELKCGIR